MSVFDIYFAYFFDGGSTDNFQVDYDCRPLLLDFGDNKIGVIPV